MLIKLILIAGAVLVTSAVVFKQKDMSYRQSILKKVYPLIMKMSTTKGKEHIQLNANNVQPFQSIYDISLTSIEGSTIDLHALQGKKILYIPLC
mgnify:CR=1 FL=1